MAKLSPADFELIESLIKHGVLKDIEGYRLDRRKGIILICCSDGDQFHDLYVHECKFNLNQRTEEDPRVHPLTCHGGVLAYYEGTPVNRFKQTYLEHLYAVGDGMQLKNMPTVVMEGHAPCGAANLHRIPLIDQFCKQMDVRTKLKGLYPQTAIASHFHIDYDGWNGKCKNTYHFGGTDEWNEWRETQSSRFLTAA